SIIVLNSAALAASSAGPTTSTRALVSPAASRAAAAPKRRIGRVNRWLTMNAAVTARSRHATAVTTTVRRRLSEAAYAVAVGRPAYADQPVESTCAAA